MKNLTRFFSIIHPKYFIYDFVKFTWLPILHLFQRPKVVYCNTEKKMPDIKGKAIIICNHTWWMDPITLILTFWRRRLYTLAAVEVLGPGKLSRFIRKNLLFVDVDRTKLDIRSFANCTEMLKKDKCLVVFPEGRFVFEDEIQSFKGGTALMALQTGAPIYPVYIHGYYKMFHPIHMAIGEPIIVSDLIEGSPDSEKIQKLNEHMHQCVQQLRENLEATLDKKDIEILKQFKKMKRDELALKADQRAKAWREAQEKGKV